MPMHNYVTVSVNEIFVLEIIVYPFLIRRYLDTKDESKTIFRDSPERKSITLYFRYVYSNMNSCTYVII